MLLLLMSSLSLYACLCCTATTAVLTITHVFCLSSLVFEWEGDVTLGPIPIQEKVIA